MRNPTKLIFRFLAITAVLLATQLSTITSSFAVGPISPQGTPGDLTIDVSPTANDRAFAATICNGGTDDIIAMGLEASATNYDIEFGVALPSGFAGSNPTNSGTYNLQTGEWSGNIEATQCVAIGFGGTVTGPIGETIDFTVTILSSTLGDSTPNTVDVNDTDTYTSIPIVADPNLVLETRLLTTGPIEDGDDVSYELIIKNIGAGQYIEDGGNPLGIYFIVPTGATFQNVTDDPISDQLNITVCGSQGNVNGFLPAFAGYDAELAGCQLDLTSGFFPAGASYKLTFNMQANGPFSSGDTEVNAILVANDVDSILIQLAIFTPSTDPFEIENDNYVYLGFDNTALRATVNRCAGVGDVVTSNSACFTMSFNKEIYAPSFDANDLLIANGEVQSLTKVGDNLWEVRLKNLAANKIVSISISPNNDILDYSAVLADTQVLGINTVRYEVGTLPETGVNNAIWQVGLFLMSLGTIFVLLLRKNNDEDSEQQLLILNRYSTHHF